MEMVRFRRGQALVQKNNPTQWMVFFLLFLPFITPFFIEVIGLPDAIRFLADGLLSVTVCLIFLQGRVRMLRQGRLLLTFITIFALFVILGSVMHYQSIFYFLWGFRNLFRFYLVFLVFCVFVDKEQAEDWLSLLDILYWVHIFLTLIQFFFLQIRQDELGGIFGVMSKTNGLSIVFMMMVMIRSLIMLFNGKEKLWLCFLKCVASVVAGALAEIKFYFFLMVIVMILAVLLTRFSWKKLLVLAGGLAVVFLLSDLLVGIYGQTSQGGFLNFATLLENATKPNYSSNEDVNRLAAIPVLRDLFMPHPMDQCFGLGLGNCDISEIDLFNSSFAQSYSHLHYNWFLAAMLFLETGYVGLGLYLAFFVICFVLAFRRSKSGEGDPIFCQMGMLFSAVAILLTFYNSSLRTEAGYLVFFALALPFIGERRASS